MSPEDVKSLEAAANAALTGMLANPYFMDSPTLNTPEVVRNAYSIGQTMVAQRNATVAWMGGVDRNPQGPADPKSEDPELAKDANRLRWLLTNGVAWKGCYSSEWQPGEWCYESQGARGEIDKAMAETRRNQR